MRACANAADVLARLDLSPAEASAPFHMQVGHVAVTVFAPQPLRDPLIAYFAEALTDAPGPGAIPVHLLPDQALPEEPAWEDWAREGGKSGRKDAVADLDGARLVRKLRSGVTFLQAPQAAIAFGPLAANLSTIVNFINTQILSASLREGWMLAHAAAAAGPSRCLAISGLSGGGKSTSILRLMDHGGAKFLSNDRVLIRGGDPARALGIPKQPRINPGTILGNARLHPLLPAARLAALRAMPQETLWDLEEKHDLFIGRVYGPDRLRYAAPLTDFWVLNWERNGTAPTRVEAVSLAERPDLLSAIVKSPGPFHQRPDGSFEPNGAAVDPAPYRAALSGVRVCEVSGRVDFDALFEAARPLFA